MDAVKKSLIVGAVVFALYEGNKMVKLNKEQIANEAKWTPTIKKAADANGIPVNILRNLLHTESRFRTDIITGKLPSPAGALGIAQIVPKWHPEIAVSDILNPEKAIPYAAKYLASMYRKYKTWPLALTAYNWGPGNLDKYGIAKAPSESVKYVKQILT